jgi:hypothetical protein
VRHRASIHREILRSVVYAGGKKPCRDAALQFGLRLGMALVPAFLLTGISAAQPSSIFNNISNLCSPYSQTQPSCGYYPVFGPTGDFAVPSSEFAAAQFTPSVAAMATDARITVVQDAPAPGYGSSGSLTLAIFSDANGLPGTQIGQASTTVSAPFCCDSATVTAWFNQPVSLDGGVPYWLVVMPGASDTYVGWVIGGDVRVPVSQTSSSGGQLGGWGFYEPSALQFAIDSGTTAGLQFIPVTPCRIADTRNATGAFGGPELSAGSTRTLDIPQSACGIPSTAVAYSLNATVVPIQSLGYLTIWPAGQTQPVASTLNSDGRVKANATITPAGTSGGVSVYASDATQFILDIDGYFVPAGTSVSGLEFYPLTPCRIADTRNATGALGGPSLTGGVARAFTVQSSACGIPSTAKAYSLNITAVPHGSLGYLTAWPTGEAQPVVSTLNSSTGVVTANAAIVPAGSGGDISLYVSDTADAILDVNGYFAPPAAGGLSLYTVNPCRALDTRNGAGAFDGKLLAPILGSTCVPPSTAQAYVLNATVVPTASLSYLTLWAAGGPQPVVSTLNATDGAVTSNMAIVPTTNGSVDAFSTDSTQLLLDISCYFAP